VPTLHDELASASEREDWSTLSVVCTIASMRIGAFEVKEPIPTLHEPHALVVIRPWVDVGSVCTLSLALMERHFQAQELARLAKPGTYFDFTRYRPMARQVNDRRETTFPNAVVYYAQREGSPDLLFVHLLEPHSLAEHYLDSIVKLFKYFGVSVYCRLESMYDDVPHTRPLIITGNAGPVQPRPGMTPEFKQAQRRYEGPVTVMNVLTDAVTQMSTATNIFVVRLPHYSRFEEDFAGTARMLEHLGAFYDFTPDPGVTQRGKLQYQELEDSVAEDPQTKAYVQGLEAQYDASYGPAKSGLITELPPDMEKFLRDLKRDL